MTDPPMCSLKELSDGTYSVDDVDLMHEILDLKKELNDNEAKKFKQKGKKGKR